MSNERYWITKKAVPTAATREGRAANVGSENTTPPQRPGTEAAGFAVGMSTVMGMVLDRRGTTHRSEWVARIVTTGYAGRPGRLSLFQKSEGMRAQGRKKRSALPLL